MKNKVLGTVMGAALLAGSGAAVADDMFAAENFSATLTFTTDYVFRGTTFSNNDAAIQGSFDWGYGPWFAGAWASSQGELDTGGGSAGATMELDLYFGWADTVGPFDLMVMPLWYTYPGQEGGSGGGRDDQTFELWTSAGMGFDSLPGTPYVTLSVNYSDEFFDCTACTGDAEEALYYSLGVAFALPDGWGIDFLWGHQDVGGDSTSGSVNNDFFGDDYDHWNVGLTKSAAGFDFDIRYHDNEDADKLNSYLGADFASDGDLVLSVSRSF
ncbi:MAG: TorF family putative porin [Pseudomonadales bacterium]